MNRFIYTILIALVAFASGCSKAEELMYSDISRVQLTDTAALNSTFVYDGSEVTRDTVYVSINTIGDISSQDRAVKIVQITDPSILNPAVAGQHFLPFDDASLKALMVVKANAVTAKLPIVLLRDPSLKEKTVRLRLELVANDQFGLGEQKSRAITIVFSDRLERFYSWRVDATQAPTFLAFGKYSTTKHQFMIDQLGEIVDERWYQAALGLGAIQHYKNLLKQRLADFNADPANIASGKAPLRELPDGISPLVSFP